MADRDNGLILALLGAGAVLFLLPRNGGPLSIFHAGTPTPAGGTTATPGTGTPAATGSSTPPIDVSPISVTTLPTGAATVIPAVAVPPLPTTPTAPLPTAQPLPIYLPAVAVGAAGSSILQDVQQLVSGSASVIKAGGALVQQTNVFGLGTDGLANLGAFMTGVGIVALVVDAAFVIASDVSDAQKAVDVWLDSSMIACLFIPVYGWIIAIVLAVVRFIFDLFMGHTLTHAQREALETARYADHLHPIFPAIATAYSPRELLRVLIDWGSGSCGGTQSVAMVTGLHNTPTPGVDLYFGDDGCYYHTGPNAGITFDQQAQWLATKGQTQDFFAIAQAGIAAQYLDAFDAQMFDIVTTRCVIYAQMAAQGLTLDDMDKIAAEYRRTDTLNRVAAIFGFNNWHGLFGMVLQPYWASYVSARTSTGSQGSLNDFAVSLGYADAVALRDAAFSGYMTVGLRVIALEDSIRSLEVELATSPTLASEFVGKGPLLMPTPMPSYTPDQNLLAYLQALEARQATLTQACAATQAATANPYGSGYIPGSTGGP